MPISSPYTGSSEYSSPTGPITQELADYINELRQQQMVMGEPDVYPEPPVGEDAMTYFLGLSGIDRGLAQQLAESHYGLTAQQFAQGMADVNAAGIRNRNPDILGKIGGEIGNLTRVGRGEVTGFADFARDAATLGAIGFGTTFLGGAAPTAAAPTGAAPAAATGVGDLGAFISAGMGPAAGAGAAGAGAATAGAAGGGSLLSTIAGGAAALPSITGAPTGAGAPPAATPPFNPPATTGGQGNWWQQILGGLGGGQDAGLMNNVFAGLTGLAGLGALAGGNDLSDLFGLTGEDASRFQAINTAVPGGGGTNYNPDTNTITGTGGNLDPVQAQLAGFAGNQITQAGQNQQGNILALLREQAAPEEQRAFNRINNNLFSRGRLGAQDSATGEAYAGFARGQSEADLARQLASFGLSDQLQTSAFGRALGATSGAAGLQREALGPYAPQTNDTRGAPNPMLEFLNQFLRRP